MSTTLQVSLTLSDDDMAVLRRYQAEINALVRGSNAMLVSLKRQPIGEEWTEEQAIQSLLQSALERERKLQQLQDGRADPSWLRQIVRESILGGERK